ncbi:MAG: endonuclease [Candidatus Lightella neohaematopini]|nr:endonuclease [Candidatus Lightella neohaematopini]
MNSKLITFVFIISVIILTIFLFTHNKQRKVYNFKEAKKLAMLVNRDISGTFYCGCKINWHGYRGIPELLSCGYKIRNNYLRAHRVEWEHIVPAWKFGHDMKCWLYGGRKNCNNDYNYKKIETDLHNLQPVIGEINADRKNYEYSQWDSNYGNYYGNCKIKINFKTKQVDPPIITRGIIARTYLYMHDKYHIILSDEQLSLFYKWNNLYPVTKWECCRNKRITLIQGNSNCYIEKACRKMNYY